MKKNSGLAAVLSFFVPGLGQIYNGELSKGMITVAVTIMAWMMTALYIGFFVLVPLWVWSIYDAYSMAEKINDTAAETTSGK